MSRIGSIVGPLLGGILLEVGRALQQNIVQSMAPFAAIAGVAVVILSFFRRAE